MSWSKNNILKTASDSLAENFFNVLVFDNKSEAIRHLINTISSDSVIGYGGSKTLEEIGFFDVFTKTSYPNILDRRDPDITPEQKSNVQKAALTSDYFLCSANAVSLTGELVLIDKWGNRCAAMTYGPSKRIFVAGINKIEPDLTAAIQRAKDKAAVLNNKRFDTKNPCTVKGRCTDCSSKDRICGVTTVIHRAFPPGSIDVILINESLGF